MFHLTLSNRVEFLLDRLLEQLAIDAGQIDVFAPHSVIVPSAALRRRVTLACADHVGICANVAFSFLAEWLWTCIAQVVPVQARSPFSPNLLAWRVYAQFGDRALTADHPRLARYLQQADPLMRLDLAKRVTQVFEHYITYRPDWLSAWSDGQRIPAELAPDKREDEAWQAALWRQITGELGIHRQHPSVAFFEKVAALGANATSQYGLPSVAHLFCLPTIPPLYLDILRHLSQWVDIRVYALNPCQEYWFEIVDPKRLHYLANRHDTGDHFYEVGNTLLASWGQPTKAYLDLLFSDEGIIVEDGSAFLPNERGTLLAHVQNAILNMVELAPSSVQPSEGDRSLEVHVCHSMTRELEVLHDRLLDLLASDDPPRPQDILVVTPNLIKAAPVIDMVFGTAPTMRRIPYTITGQPQTQVNPVAHLMDTLLTVCGGRFVASAVFALLQQDPVAERYGLDGAALDQIHRWIQQSGICWGWDAEQRVALGLPKSERHSFSDGMDRLFLSYALGDRATDTILHGCLPAGNPEGLDAISLGRFWRFLDQLNRVRCAWSRPLRPEEWQRSLNDALDHFVPDSLAWMEDLRAVRDAIARLCRDMVEGGTGSALPLELIRQALVDEWSDPIRGGIPTGTVTFSSIASLRSLSYRVICVIGMDDATFPGTQYPAEFDLMACAPRRGDRQRRTDERNLFLDLLLSARDAFHISYRGRSIRDNRSMPPSVLVAELLDYLAAATAFPQEGERLDGAMVRARRRLIVAHPLQAFSSVYFTGADDARLHSYHAEYCDALRQRLEASQQKRSITPPLRDKNEEEETATEREVGDTAQIPFFTDPLPPPPEEARSVSLEQLERFFRNPCRVVLRQRLNITLAASEELLQDDEPFLGEYPNRQAMAQRLLPTLLARCDNMPDLFALAAAGNEFPTGAFGQRLLEEELVEIQSFADRLASELSSPILAPLRQVLPFDIEGESWQLVGDLVDVRASGLVRYRYDDTRPMDYLAGWFAHLFLCAVQSPSTATTQWHSRDGCFSFKTCENAREELGNLLAVYRSGLLKPVHFFPKSAWAYCTSSGTLRKAQEKWINDRDYNRSESANLSYQLALRGVADPLDEEFCSISRMVFDPLLRHLQDSRL